MPYIECPDGKTYSRYDNSPYVVWCIKHEDSVANARYLTCMQDPICKAEMDRINKIEKNVLIGMFLFFAILLIVMFFYKKC